MDSARMRRLTRRNRHGLVMNILLCLIALSALTGCIYLLFQNNAANLQIQAVNAQLEEAEARKDEFVFTQADVDAFSEAAAQTSAEDAKQTLLGFIKEQMSGGTSTAELLRGLYPENIVVFSDAQYYFFPISDELLQHSYIKDNFKVNDSQELEYWNEAGEVASLKGIDVSKYQEKINWEKVAADGVNYAFVRAGVRGSTEGAIIPDDTFDTNMKGAAKNGIATGVYFYTQAITEEEAVEEAEFILSSIQDYNVTYPIVIDIEEPTSKSARTAGMTQEEWTKVCIAFCERIKEAGYTPMIYGNLKTFMIMLDMTQLESYEKWFAYYNTEEYFPYQFGIWQYSSNGTVDGIKGTVDMNVGMKAYDEQ